MSSCKLNSCMLTWANRSLSSNCELLAMNLLAVVFAAELQSNWKVESFKRKAKVNKNWKAESQKQKFHLYNIFLPLHNCVVWTTQKFLFESYNIGIYFRNFWEKGKGESCKWKAKIFLEVKSEKQKRKKLLKSWKLKAKFLILKTASEKQKWMFYVFAFQRWFTRLYWWLPRVGSLLSLSATMLSWISPLVDLPPGPLVSMHLGKLH